MSKKRYSTQAWKERIKRAQAREAAKGKRKRRIGRGGTPPAGAFSFRSSRTLRPPEVLSLAQNPIETIGFLNELERELPRARVFIEFADVKIITPDAPLALIGTLNGCAKKFVQGSVPQSTEARAILEQSGFFEHVRHGITLQGTCQGVIAKYTGTQVDSELARKLVWRGTELLFGERRDSEASFGILVEGMENTIAHAHQISNQDLYQFWRPIAVLNTEQWWASVYVDRARGKICFAVLDQGVGVLGSAKVKIWRRLDRLFRSRADAEILEAIFNGEMQSRTGLEYRGKGLPEIKRLNESGEIQNLTFLTNAVHAKLTTRTFETLPQSFHGTLLYWEIEK